MDQGAAERITRKDVLYRLAMLLDIAWPDFQRMELWAMRNRAFVAGESIVESKIAALDAAVTAQSVHKSKEPSKAQQEFEAWYRKAVTVEDEPTSEQTEESYLAHNKAFFERLSNEN